MGDEKQEQASSILGVVMFFLALAGLVSVFVTNPFRLTSTPKEEPAATRQELCKDPCQHYVCTSTGLWPDLIADYERCVRQGGKDITNRD